MILFLNKKIDIFYCVCYPLTVRRKKKILPFVLAFLVFLLAASVYVVLVNPHEKLSVFSFTVSPTFPFIALLFGVCFCLFFIIFLNTRRAFFVSVFIVTLIMLRIFHYWNLGYITIIFILYFMLEAVFTRRQKRIRDVL